MSDIQTLIASAESENQVITQLSSVITTLVNSYTGLQQQVAVLQGQLKNGVSVSQQQIDLLQEDITAGNTAAVASLAAAQAALTPATPAPDPTPTPVPEPIPTPPAANPDAPVDPSVN